MLTSLMNALPQQVSPNATLMVRPDIEPLDLTDPAEREPTDKHPTESEAWRVSRCHTTVASDYD